MWMTHPVVYQQLFLNIGSSFSLLKWTIVYLLHWQLDTSTMAICIPGQSPKPMHCFSHWNILKIPCTGIFSFVDTLNLAYKLLKPWKTDYLKIVCILSKMYFYYYNFLKQKLNYRILFCWVLGHCGLSGNKDADMTAKKREGKKGFGMVKARTLK